MTQIGNKILCRTSISNRKRKTYEIKVHDDWMMTKIEYSYRDSILFQILGVNDHAINKMKHFCNGRRIFKL